MLLLSFFLLDASAVTPGNDIEIIRKRVVSGMMEQRVNDSRVKSLMDSIKDNGTWPGINYEDVSRTGFQHSQHLENLVTMCRAYKKAGSKLKGDVVVMADNKKSVLQNGERVLSKVKWVLHDSVAYFFPEPVTVNLSNQAATGSWYRINHQSDSPKDEISKDIFKLWIDHGKQPENEKYFCF